MILKLLLNTQMTWMIFVKTLKNATQIKKRKILIDDMILPDMFNNNNKKKTELFIRYRELNISVVFITQSYFSVSKNITLNSTHYLIMEES